MQYHYLSSYKMTILIGVNCGKIVTTPPIAKVFVGQPFDNILKWMKSQGGLIHQPLEN